MTNQHHRPKRAIKKTLLIRGALFPLILLAFTLFVAGRIDYWQGWVYNILNMIILAVTMIVLADKPDLIEERLKPGRGMKKWDKVYFAVTTPLYLAAVIVSAIDAGRYGWPPRVPTAVVILGTVLYVLGQSLFLWAKSVNRFFSAVVRIQTDRGQTVCKDGPYRWVRHPGYFCGMLFGLSMPLVLGSYWGIIPAAVGNAGLILRTGLEDRLLRKELPGYEEYTREVRYRLIPGIW